MTISLDKLNAKIFSEQLRTTFKLNGSFNPPVMLELEEVKEGDPVPKIELFSLFFRGPAVPHLPQLIYCLEHDKLGTFEIFLTAVSSEPAGILYESVFHRFRKPAA
jgi:hypothetical protein